MSETSALRIHAKIKPEDIRQPVQKEEESSIRIKPIQVASGRRVRRIRPKPKLSYGDRLLRNSAIACAVLLGVLALGNVETPWAQKASEGIERALTMHIDLDEHIGALQFVKNIMPESALVFMNVTGETALARPVEGALSHGWTNLQPWLMFSCPDDADVHAAAVGTVTAVSPLSDGKYGVLIDHGEGLESLYAYLADVDVQTGDAVVRGQEIGEADGNLYFEYRSGGESIDPAGELGL